MDERARSRSRAWLLHHLRVFMSLVLARQYLSRSIWDFYASRMLKLVPLYLVVSAFALVSAAIFTGDQSFFHTYDPLAAWRRVNFWSAPIGVQLYSAFTMLTLIGSDTWTWIGFNPLSGVFSVAPKFSPGATTPMSLSPVPQAWTLGLEISFYLVAPFLARQRIRWIVLCLAASIVARLVLYNFWPLYPTYARILGPLEIVFFLYGMIVHRLTPEIERYLASFTMHAIIAGVGVTLLIGLRIVAVITEAEGDDIASLVILGLLLPSIFIVTRSSRLDELAGSLSYPVYVLHFPALALAYHSGLTTLASGKWSELTIYLAAVVCLAIIAKIAIVGPLDRIRTKFGARTGRNAAGEGR